MLLFGRSPVAVSTGILLWRPGRIIVTEGIIKWPTVYSRRSNGEGIQYDDIIQYSLRPGQYQWRWLTDYSIEEGLLCDYWLTVTGIWRYR